MTVLRAKWSWLALVALAAWLAGCHRGKLEAGSVRSDRDAAAAAAAAADDDGTHASPVPDAGRVVDAALDPERDAAATHADPLAPGDDDPSAGTGGGRQRGGGSGSAGRDASGADADGSSGTGDSGAQSGGGAAEDSDSGSADDAGTGCPAPDDGVAPVESMRSANFRRVPFSGSALAADLTRPRLYALATADDPIYGGQLVILDSVTGSITDAMPVGADPTSMAMTADGNTLWVGSRSSLELRRVDLTAAAPVLTDTYALPAEWGSLRDSLVVVPPATLGVSTLIDLRAGDGGTFLGQVTFSGDDAVASAASGWVASQVAAGPAGHFFAYNDYSSGFEFYTVDATGGALDATAHGLLLYGYGRQIVYDPDGYVYASSGEVIDVRDPDAPQRAGRFALGGTFVPLAGSDRVLLVSSPSTQDVVHLLDTRTFSRVSWLTDSFAFDEVRSAVALGSDRVAFLGERSYDWAIYLSNALQSDPPQSKIDATPRGTGRLEYPIAARALAADPQRNVLYAAVGGAASIYANRVVTIDLERAEIVNTLPVGSEPSALALSEDASVLWVGLDGSFSVRPIELGCTSAQPVGPHAYLPLRTGVRRMLPLSGHGRGVAAVMDQGSVALFEQGLLPFDELYAAPSVVAGPPGVFFAYEDTVSDYTFYTVTFGVGGVSRSGRGGVFSGYNKDLAYDPDGYVYSTWGEVADVRNPLVPSLVGTFPVRGTPLPLPGPTALMVTGSQVLKLDATSFTQVDARGHGCTTYDTITDLIHVAPGRIAFVTFSSFVPDTGAVCVFTDLDFIP